MTADRNGLPRVMSLKVAVLLFLSFVSILFSSCHDPYAVTGPEILQNPLFRDGLDNWQHSDAGVSVSADESGAIELRSQDPSALTHVTQIIPDPQRFHLVRFAADLKTHRVQKGDASWQTARLILAPYDSEGKMLPHSPHTLAGETGNREWKHHERVFRVNEDAAELRLSAQLMRATGSMWARNISLKPVTEREVSSLLRVAILSLWLLAITWVAIPLMRFASGTRSGLIAMVVVLCIAAGALLPASIKKHVDRSLPYALFPVEQASMSGTVSGSVRVPPAISVYKLGHVALFATLSAVTFLGSFRSIPARRRVGYLLLFAMITEVLQLFVEGRDARIGDAFLDVTGISIGAATAVLLKALAGNPCKSA
jgi:hypothetical protein